MRACDRTDGVLCTLIRIGAAATDEDKRWYMFDGPVDAIWIESMNTVLDDNKKLCLTSGEIIKLTEVTTAGTNYQYKHRLFPDVCFYPPNMLWSFYFSMKVIFPNWRAQK